MRLLTFETSDQSDEKTRPEQQQQKQRGRQRPNENDDKYIENTLKEGFLKTFREQPQMAIQEKFCV